MRQPTPGSTARAIYPLCVRRVVLLAFTLTYLTSAAAIIAFARQPEFLTQD